MATLGLEWYMMRDLEEIRALCVYACRCDRETGHQVVTGVGENLTTRSGHRSRHLSVRVTSLSLLLDRMR